MSVMVISLLILILVLVGILILISLRSHNNNRQLDAMREYINGLNESNRRNIEMLQQTHSTEILNLTRRYEQESQLREQQWQNRLEEIEKRSQLTFQQLSRSALDGSVDRLKNTNGEMISGLLNPLAEQLSQLSQLIHNVRVETESSSKSLVSKINSLEQLNITLSDDAKSLTAALKGNSKVQGDWGETILRTILEKAGLEEGINFRVQPGSDENGRTFRGEDNNALRPDFIIDLPGGRKLVVDSKVSLTAYLKYSETSDDNLRSQYGRQHVESVKKHINELRSKRYEKAVAGAMEHVLMFMPNEGAYLAAMTIDTDLWQYAYQHKVVIVSAPHLLSAVQIISQLWRQERQDRNAMEIARVAGLLYDSFVSFSEKLASVGLDLERTRKNFDNVAGMLKEDNNKSLLRRALKLKELGAKTTRSLPEESL